ANLNSRQSRSAAGSTKLELLRKRRRDGQRDCQRSYDYFNERSEFRFSVRGSSACHSHYSPPSEVRQRHYLCDRAGTVSDGSLWVQRLCRFRSSRGKDLPGAIPCRLPHYRIVHRGLLAFYTRLQESKDSE